MKNTHNVYDNAGNIWQANHLSCPVCSGCRYRELFKLVKSKCNPKRPEDTFVKCDNCGLVYVNPRILFPLEQITGNSQENSKIDLDRTTNDRLSCYELQEDLERIKSYKSTGKLLDIGCATGAFLHLASKAGYNTKGVEPVIEQAAYARKRYDLDVIQGYIGDPRQSINLPDEEFDVVVMLAVIEHVLDVHDVIRAASRCLRHGGILYLTTPDVSSFLAHLKGSNWSMYHICWHHQFFNYNTLQSLLKDHGLRILEKWGTYRGSPNFSKRLFKRILNTFGISLDVITVLAEKI